MAENSKIGWTRHTANLWWGCTHAQSIGCDNCYAETLSKRWGHDIWGNDKPRKATKSVWNDLVRYQKMAAEADEIHRVFVGSMMDIFEKPMPLIEPITLIERGKTAIFGTGPFRNTGELRQYFFEVVVEKCPNLMFLLLTKRPSNINKYIPERWKDNPPKNVMFGTSPVDQATADRLIPQLLEVNGKRFLSVEPQLAEISLEKYLWQPKSYCDECGTGGIHLEKPCDNDCKFKPINWVICGGESGPKKRPFDPEWARLLLKQCRNAKVAIFMKQWDQVRDLPEDLKHILEFPVIERNDICTEDKHAPGCACPGLNAKEKRLFPNK